MAKGQMTEGERWAAKGREAVMGYGTYQQKCEMLARYKELQAMKRRVEAWLIRTSTRLEPVQESTPTSP